MIFFVIEKWSENPLNGQPLTPVTPTVSPPLRVCHGCRGGSLRSPRGRCHRGTTPIGDRPRPPANETGGSGLGLTSQSAGGGRRGGRGGRGRGTLRLCLARVAARAGESARYRNLIQQKAAFATPRSPKCSYLKAASRNPPIPHGARKGVAPPHIPRTLSSDIVLRPSVLHIARSLFSTPPVIGRPRVVWLRGTCDSNSAIL
jgi:hypothetical protein